MSANDKQVGGTHYGGGALQHWDVVSIMELDYFQGQITKYVMRWKKKNGVEDLKKAAHFLEKYIELNEVVKQQAPYTRTPPGEFGVSIHTDIGPVDSDSQFRAEGWYGDGVVHYVCRHCHSVVYAKGLARAHELHDCKSAKS